MNSAEYKRSFGSIRPRKQFLAPKTSLSPSAMCMWAQYLNHGSVRVFCGYTCDRVLRSSSWKKTYAAKYSSIISDLTNSSSVLCRWVERSEITFFYSTMSLGHSKPGLCPNLIEISRVIPTVSWKAVSGAKSILNIHPHELRPYRLARVLHAS